MATLSVLEIRPARLQTFVRHTPELFTFSCVLDDSFVYQAGQWVYLHLLQADGTSLARAAFSMASAPHESDFSFGVKIYGRFTETLASFQEGTMIGVQGPFGVFLLPSDDTPLVFFGGGIGITPLRSLLARALHEKTRTAPLVLFWTARSQDELLYHEEFLAWERANPERFSYRPALTREPRTQWTGLRGRISNDMLENTALDWTCAQAFVCGSVVFMDEIKALLAMRGIIGRSRLHEERFA